MNLLSHYTTNIQFFPHWFSYFFSYRTNMGYNYATTEKSIAEIHHGLRRFLY